MDYLQPFPPYLPWALLVMILGLLHLRLRSWSVKFSNSIVQRLEECTKSNTHQPIVQNTGYLSPLDAHKQIILQHLEQLPADANTRIGALVNDLALVKLLRQLEGIYDGIFRSQIFLLRSLNIVNGMADLATIENHFNGMCEENPELRKVDFRNWLQFLSSAGTISVSDAGVGITSLGQEFLVWMVRQKKPDKPHERF